MTDKEEITDKLRRMFKNIAKAEGVSVGEMPFEGRMGAVVVLHFTKPPKKEGDKIAEQLAMDIADIIESIVVVGDKEKGGRA